MRVAPYTVTSMPTEPRTPKVTCGRPLAWAGPSKKSQMSMSSSVSDAISMYRPRLREPASSSPSNMKTRFDVGVTPASSNACRAERMAAIGALSSPAERAYSLHSGSTASPSRGSGMGSPPASIAAV